ncbi:DNA polymerase IV (family X) [Thioflavicoccus mobilis 8321]|uniref:DNA polymerase beta n=1 Tax=Thioflavicoccus mobilis 8321 TaxID=765912 RepID=L0GWH6_9GAMM|nr:DNA polymerase/3'-5' exonuclease PolX [Thioflavicoccus mobilis]AGA90182.1 DNA polymerase IV (family X) [Thioflavicoccus mobilis 8321]
MSIQNREIAAIFEEIADLLEIEGADAFRVRAYREAARLIPGLAEGLAERVANGADLTELPSIGEAIAKKIAVIVETGRLPQLEEVRRRVPPSLRELLQLGGLGPKRVKALREALGVASLADLRQAVEAGKVHELPGFGEKTEAQLRERLARWQGPSSRTPLIEAEELVRPLVEHLRGGPGILDLAVAGSFRRRRETVGDLDILVACDDGAAVAERFVGYDAVAEVLSHGETRASVRLRSGIQVDLRVVPPVSWGAALHYFTGSQSHNVAVRRRGVERGLKISEYGVYRGEEAIAGRTEESVYTAVGLPFIVPELREDRGEIEAGERGALPDLVTLDDIRGDLHAHTDASDGHDSLAAMAEAAAALGYEYLAITDHTKHLGVAHGLDAKRLAAQIAAIDRLNERLAKRHEGRFQLLKASEIDILEDGSLDLPDEILARLDLRVASIHHRFDLPEHRQTERVIRAMDNRHVNILAHPTGRLIGAREPYAIDLERVMRAALERGCFLELNAQPSRLDLTDLACQQAKELGLKVAISTDAHSRAGLERMRLGIGQARRGWLSADDVINSRGLAALRRLLRRA